MVNWGTVNTRAALFFYRIFARFLHFFTVILRLKNPVKYSRILCVNGCRSQAPPFSTVIAA